MNDQRYLDFFLTVIEGVHEMMFLSVGKIFDKNRSESLDRLLANLKESNEKDLAHQIELVFEQNKDTIGKIKMVRDKSVAHNDPMPSSKVFEKAGVTYNEIRALIDSTCCALNKVAEETAFPNRISKGARYEDATLSLLEFLRLGKASLKLT